MIIHEVTLKEAKLPFNTIRGSKLDRQNKVDHLFLRFYRELNPLCNGKQCSIDNLKKTIDKVLEPHKINYQIKPEKNKKYNGSLSVDYSVTQKNFDIDINITGYTIYLPINKNNNIIENKYTVYHEIRHFFDHLYNPKYNLLNISNKLLAPPKEVKQVEKLHTMLLRDIITPTSMAILGPKMDSTIHNISNSLAIDELQNIKYTIESEINAYTDELNCKYKNGLYKDALNLKKYLLTNFKFKAKLRYINAKLKEIITQERDILRKQNNQ